MFIFAEKVTTHTKENQKLIKNNITKIFKKMSSKLEKSIDLKPRNTAKDNILTDNNEHLVRAASSITVKKDEIC